MSTLLRLEFVTQPGDDEILVPRTDGRWGSFQNTYAVWDSFRSVAESIIIRRKIELQKGYYYVVGTVDDSGSVTVNGSPCFMYRFDTSVNTAITAGQSRVYHPGGLMNIVINASNAGDVAGVAVTIHAELVNDTSRDGITRSVGDLVWSTRTPRTSKIGRYLFTMPYSAAIEAHVWGAGGAGGAGYDGPTLMEFNPPGGNGSPGLYNTRTFNVSAGDTVEIFVGSGGNAATVLRGGGADGANAPGGPGGASRISAGGVAAESYNGGQGGLGGIGIGGSVQQLFGGGSGGGGGGGASGVLVNNSPVIVAGGGGGGGGSGPAADSIQTGTFGDSNANINKNATGSTTGDNRGENGKGLASTDGSGGGGGGGGGGYPGGQGGLDRGSLTQPLSVGGYYRGGTGFCGECGGNFPIFEATTGSDTLYYNSSYGKGGAGGRGAAYNTRTGDRVVSIVSAELGESGTDGRVVLIINGSGFSSIKVANQWREITQAFVKSGNVWKEITNLHIKRNDVWVPISGGGVYPNINNIASDYGLSIRSWS